MRYSDSARGRLTPCPVESDGVVRNSDDQDSTQPGRLDQRRLDLAGTKEIDDYLRHEVLPDEISRRIAGNPWSASPLPAISFGRPAARDNAVGLLNDRQLDLRE